MRVRKRYAVMLAIAASIVGVVLFQAVTAKPPEPYVELVGPMPPAPEIYYTCSEQGEQMLVYVTGDGRELPPVPTSPRRLCDHVFPGAHQPTPEQ